MTDLETLRKLLGKQDRTPCSDWHLDPTEELNEGADHVLVFGCPDGVGAYLQCLFDADGRLTKADVINTNGDPCSCKWCAPPKKRGRRKK